MEVVKLSDYVERKMAVGEGEMEGNGLERIWYLKGLKKEDKLKVWGIGRRVIGGMGI